MENKEEKEPRFGYRCPDGEIVNLDPRCFYECELLCGFLELRDMMREEQDIYDYFDYRDISRAGYLKIPKDILLLVNKYCVGRFNIMKTYQHHDDLGLVAAKLREFDSEFLRDPTVSLLVELVTAAFQLKIKSLMNLVLKAMDHGGFADAIFNMPAIKNFESPFYLGPIWAPGAIDDE